MFHCVGGRVDAGACAVSLYKPSRSKTQYIQFKMVVPDLAQNFLISGKLYALRDAPTAQAVEKKPQADK